MAFIQTTPEAKATKAKCIEIVVKVMESEQLNLEQLVKITKLLQDPQRLKRALMFL